ncbi:hypothetical protein AAGC94_18325 [Clostridium sporogenes]|uniref:hypothetical protein n=1 Tax=Bacteria TaxID=2 RepID=UPI00313EDC8C
MYETNSAKMNYFRNRNQQQYDSYDDDFKGFTKEAEAAKDEYSKEEKKKKGIFSFLFRKASNGQP